ncbi:MAG: hypothetical protein ACRD07_16520, partial [Acidimicrobiales bacterium]
MAVRTVSPRARWRRRSRWIRRWVAFGSGSAAALAPVGLLAQLDEVATARRFEQRLLGARI